MAKGQVLQTPVPRLRFCLGLIEMLRGGNFRKLKVIMAAVLSQS